MKKKTQNITFLYNLIMPGGIYLSTNKFQFYKNIRKNKLPHKFDKENTCFSKIYSAVVVSSKIENSYIQMLITKDSFICEELKSLEEAYYEIILPAFKIRDHKNIIDVLNF